jgi:hypothetical protein
MDYDGLGHRTLQAAMMLVVFTLAGELFARLAPLRPRIQVIDERVTPVEVVDGLPTWTLHADVHDALADWTCEGRAHVILAGDSVFSLTDAHGHSVRADNLARFLADRWPDVCFHNVSEPGHGPAQQRLRAARALERVGPSFLVFQVYKTDAAFRYVPPRWYELGPYERNAAGVPVVPLLSDLLPDEAEAALFDRSALFRDVSMTFGRAAPPRLDQYRAALDDPDPRWRGKVFLETPPMDLPFADVLARRATSRDGESFRLLQKDVLARGAAYVVHAETLLDTTPEALRTDPCCHVHAEGHRRMADALVGPLTSWLGPPSPPGSAP